LSIESNSDLRVKLRNLTLHHKFGWFCFIGAAWAGIYAYASWGDYQRPWTPHHGRALLIFIVSFTVFLFCIVFYFVARFRVTVLGVSSNAIQVTPTPRLNSKPFVVDRSHISQVVVIKEDRVPIFYDIILPPASAPSFALVVQLADRKTMRIAVGIPDQEEAFQALKSIRLFWRMPTDAPLPISAHDAGDRLKTRRIPVSARIALLGLFAVGVYFNAKTSRHTAPQSKTTFSNDSASTSSGILPSLPAAVNPAISGNWTTVVRGAYTDVLHIELLGQELRGTMTPINGNKLSDSIVGRVEADGTFRFLRIHEDHALGSETYQGALSKDASGLLRLKGIFLNDIPWAASRQ